MLPAYAARDGAARVDEGADRLLAGGPARKPRLSRHNLCTCGNCPGCLRTFKSRERLAAKYGCRCGNKNCDCAEWQRRYDARFSESMREYYAPREPEGVSPQSSLRGIERDGSGFSLDLSGKCGDPTRWKNELHAAAAIGMRRRRHRQ